MTIPTTEHNPYATNPHWWDGWTGALRGEVAAIPDPDSLRELDCQPTDNVRDEVGDLYAEAERKAHALLKTCRAARQVLALASTPHTEAA